MALDFFFFFLPLNLFLLSSLISFTYLPFRQKILKSTEEQELEKRMKMQQEVVEMRKRNEEFKKFALAGAGQFGSDWVWFMRWCFSYPWWFLKSQKQKCLSWSVVSVKRCVYLGGWTWVPFISQWSFPRMFYVHWSFLRACCRSSPSLTVEVTPIFFFFLTPIFWGLFHEFLPCFPK